MSSATNRTERLAKALKECRPDFSLHNARAFARAVIDAPGGVFGAKPLTFLPGEQTDGPVRSSVGEYPIAGTNLESPVPAGPVPAGGVQWTIPDSGAEMIRLTGEAGGGKSVPISLADAAPGDLVVHPDGTSSLYLGNGKMLVGDAVIDTGAQPASRLLRLRGRGADHDVTVPPPPTDRGSRRANIDDDAGTRAGEIPRPPLLDRPQIVGLIEGELERTWDAGNASGLDGWIGPGRGAGEVDDYAVSQRQRDTSGALGRIIERLYPVKHPTQ